MAFSDMRIYFYVVVIRKCFPIPMVWILIRHPQSRILQQPQQQKVIQFIIVVNFRIFGRFFFS